MIVKLAIYSDGKRDQTLLDLDKILQDFFQKKFYSANVENIFIGVITIAYTIGYEHWYKPRKSKYTYHKVLKSSITKDKTHEINKTYECEFRLSEDDYNRFISELESVSKIILGTYILETLSDLNYLCKKVKDFKKEEFINDLTICLKENGYLE